MGCRISQEEHLAEKMKVTADLEQQLQTSVARRVDFTYQNAIFESNRSSVSSWITTRNTVSFMSNSPSVVKVAIPSESASVNLVEQSDGAFTPMSETYSTQMCSSSTGEDCSGVNRGYVTYLQYSPTNSSKQMYESSISEHSPLGVSDWTQLTKDYGAWAPGFAGD